MLPLESSFAIAPGPPLLVPLLDRALDSHCDCHEVVMHEKDPELLAKSDKGCRRAKYSGRNLFKLRRGPRTRHTRDNFHRSHFLTRMLDH